MLRILSQVGVLQNIARQLGCENAVAGKFVGMDIVEVAPGYDFANRITCITAGRLLLNAIGASWGAQRATE